MAFFKRSAPEHPDERTEERPYGEKKIRFHVADADRILWIEIISPNGDVVEIDPNYVDIAPFRELLSAPRQG
jgi:hypothetical protein